MISHYKAKIFQTLKVNMGCLLLYLRVQDLMESNLTPLIYIWGYSVTMKEMIFHHENELWCHRLTLLKGSRNEQGRVASLILRCLHSWSYYNICILLFQLSKMVSKLRPLNNNGSLPLKQKKRNLIG